MRYLIGVGAVVCLILAFALATSPKAAPPGPHWSCSLLEAGHWSEYDVATTNAADLIVADCDDNGGYGCPGHEKAWLWLWVPAAGGGGTWVMCGSGPFVDRDTYLDCGIAVVLRAGVNLNASGPPGNNWCITHRLWDSYATVLTTEQSFFTY